MPVIKQQVLPARPSPFSLGDIEQQATDILARARYQADAMLREAQKDAEALRNKWHDEGFESGRIAGFEYGQDTGHKAGADRAFAEHSEQFRLAITALDAARAELTEHLERIQSEAADEVMHLSIALARKIVKQLGTRDPAALRANVVEAMKLVARAKSVRIAINPAQKRQLDEQVTSIAMDVPHFALATIVEDASIQPGGCRVLTPQGSIDADLNVQFDRIVADLMPAPTLPPVPPPIVNSTSTTEPS